MQVEVQEVEYCKLNVKYKADLDIVSKKQKEALKQLNKSPIPGFRAGKAPEFAIKQFVSNNKNLKQQVDNWVKRELLSQAYDDILFETKIKTIGQPQVVSLNLTDISFNCELTLMKRPEFTLKNYKELEIPKPPQSTSSSELTESMLQELRVQHGDIAPFSETDFVQNDDQVTMDFEILVDGTPINEGVGEGVLYTVGQANIFPEFDSNLLGMTAGETRGFDVVLPENFKEQPGKKAHVNVTVHMGTKKTPAPLDDELAKKVGCTDFNDLRTKVEHVASSKMQSVEMALLSQQITKRLVSDNDCQVPQWLALMEAQYISLQESKKWEALNASEQEGYLSRAKDNVKISLILNAIQEQEPEACLADTEALNVVKHRVASMGQDANAFLTDSQNNGQLLGLIASLKNEYSLQWLIKQAKIIE